jgi:hypothetical protein
VSIVGQVGEPTNPIAVYSGLTRFIDSGSDPTQSGEMRTNGTDVKVYSGGAVRNLSNIGAGGSGAWTDSGGDGLLGGDLYALPAGSDGVTIGETRSDVVNLEDTGTDPSNVGEGRVNSGDVVFYSGGAVRNLSNIGSGGTSAWTDSGDTTPTGGDEYSLPSASDGIDVGSADALVYTLTGSGVDPASVGEFRVNGTDVKVFSDGAVRNLSDVGQTSGEGVLQKPDVTERVQVENNATVAKGIPIPDGHQLEIWGWGVRNMDDATPSGLEAVVLDETDSVVQSESTAWAQSTGTPRYFFSNSSGSTVWYAVGVRNTTGTDYLASNNDYAEFAVSYRVIKP